MTTGSAEFFGTQRDRDFTVMQIADMIPGSAEIFGAQRDRNFLCYGYVNDVTNGENFPGW
jgi:hypothetical protein